MLSARLPAGHASHFPLLFWSYFSLLGATKHLLTVGQAVVISRLDQEQDLCFCSLCFETRCCYVSKADVKPAQSSCLRFPSVWIIGIRHNAWLGLWYLLWLTCTHASPTDAVCGQHPCPSGLQAAGLSRSKCSSVSLEFAPKAWEKSGNDPACPSLSFLEFVRRSK